MVDPAGLTETRHRSGSMPHSFQRRFVVIAMLLLFGTSVPAQVSPETPDIPPKFEAPTSFYNYDKRDVMIPMRDGVKLHTVIAVPHGANHAPIILTRTPYNASGRAQREASPYMLATLPQGDEVFVRDGYIRVFQDIRGKYGSEGEYMMTRPLRGPPHSLAAHTSHNA